jgi:hypothetical protein
MAELTTPFDYREILIGDEIIYRCHVQQEQFAQQGLYGAEWTEADQIEKSSAYFKFNVLRADFTIPSEYQHCIPEPPCPWDKQEDKVDITKIKPVIFGADGVYTYVLAVHQRTDGQNSFTVGAKVIDYTNDQSALAANIRNEFLYFAMQEISAYQGKSVFVIERFHRGNSDRTFYYLFDLLR